MLLAFGAIYMASLQSLLTEQDSQNCTLDEFTFESSEEEDLGEFNGLDGDNDEDSALFMAGRHADQSPDVSHHSPANTSAYAAGMTSGTHTPSVRTLFSSSGSVVSTDGRGKYSRQGGKGKHLTWADRCAEHLRLYATGAWLQQNPCDESCHQRNKCLQSISSHDVRDCALHIFGHTNEGAPPTVSHGTATARWFETIFNSRTMDPDSGKVTGLTFRLQHGSGLIICSRAACFLFAAPPTTWQDMERTVRTGGRSWRDNALNAPAISRAAAETKKGDACVWWLDRFLAYAPPPLLAVYTTTNTTTPGTVAHE